MLTETEQLYLRPTTVPEALRLAAEHAADFSFIAGGTDVMVHRFQGNNRAGCLIDLSGLEELNRVWIEDHTLKIGALIRLDDLKNYPEIVTRFPVLIAAARAVGSPMIRKMGTIGGNVLCENRCTYFNQSDFGRETVNFCLKSGGDICIATGGPRACFSEFASDTAPALISLNAKVEIEDRNEVTVTPLEDIYTGDGVAPRNLPKTALLKAIHLSLKGKYRSVFKKLSPRHSVDFTSLTMAISLEAAGRMKIVLGGVNPKPVVITATVQDDPKKLIREALRQSKTVENDVYSRLYRREMIEVFLRRGWEGLVAKSD